MKAFWRERVGLGMVVTVVVALSIGRGGGVAQANDWPSRALDGLHGRATSERSGVSFRGPGWTWRHGAAGADWNTSSAAVAEGLVVFGARDGGVQALAASTGQARWRFQAGGGVLASPTIVRGRVFVPAMDGNLYALRLADGALIWRRSLSGGEGLEQSSPTVVGGDSVLVAGGYPARQLYRVSMATGEIIWTTPVALMAQFSNSTVATDGEQVVVGAMDGHVYAFDLTTGLHRWTYVADGVVNLSAPAIVRNEGTGGGRVYLLPGGASGKLHAVDLETGAAVPGWPVALPAPPIDGGGVAGKLLVRSHAVSSLAVAAASPGRADGGGPARLLLLDIRFDDSFDTTKNGVSDRFVLREYVMAVDAADGRVAWQRENGARVLGSENDVPKNWLCPTPALYRATGQAGEDAPALALAASSLDAAVRTLDLASGAVRATTTTAGPTRLSPVLANGRLIVGTEGGVVQGQLSSGNQPPAAPAVLGAVGRAIGNRSPMLRWTAPLDPNGDSVSYVVRLDRDGEVLEDSELEMATAAGVTSVRLMQDLQAGETYVVAVRARDVHGAWSDWSAPSFLRAVETPAVSVGGQGQGSFAEALAAAATAGGGAGTVKLGPGTFHLSETMRVPAGVMLEGAGAGQTILDATGQPTGVALEGTVDGKPSGVKGLTVTGAKVGIAVSGARDVRITNVIVRDNWETGIDVGASGSAQIANATLAANGRALRAFGATTLKNSLVTGNHTAFVTDGADTLVSRYNNVFRNGVATAGGGADQPAPGAAPPFGTSNLGTEIAFANYSKRDLRVLPGQPSTDQGDPADDFAAEPPPNGNRINLGAFGGTAEAELSNAAPTSGDSTAIGPLSSGGGCSVAGGAGSGGAKASSLSSGPGFMARGLLFAAAVLLFLVRRRKNALVLALLASLVSSARPTSAITCTFQGTGGSGGVVWATSTRWDKTGTGGNLNCPPGPNDAAVFDNGSRTQVVETDIDVGSITITSAFGGFIDFNTGVSVRVRGNYSQAARPVDASLVARMDVDGDFILSGGTWASPTTGVPTLLKVKGAFNKTGGTFTAGTGRVMLSATTNETFASNGATFYNLVVNDGLVGYWPLDENTGSIIADRGGEGNNGTLVNTPTWISGANLPTLKHENTAGVSFDGSNDYATLGITSLPAANAAKTISFWAYWASKPTSSHNMIAVLGPTGGVQIGFNGSSQLIKVWQGATVFAASSTTPTSGWHHIAYTYDGTTNTLYIDGLSAGTSITAPPSSAVTTAWLGTYNGVNELFAGRLDEVRVYNRALTASQVALMAEGYIPSTSVATTTLTGNPIVTNDFRLSSGTLAAGNTTITVAGNWWNFGGVFTTGSTGNVTFNGTGTGKIIRNGEHAFNDVTISGSGAWAMPDTRVVNLNGDLAISAGTLTATPGRLEIGGAFNKTGGTFTHNSGQVMLNATTDQTFASASAAFHDLTINDGMVGYWKLDEATGTAVADDSGYENDGTVSGATWSTSAASLPTLAFNDPAGLSFDGVNDKVELGTSSMPAANASQTVSLWVKATAAASTQNFIALRGTSSGVQVGIRQVATVWSVVAWKSGGITLVSTPATSFTGAWHHVVYTFDGTNHQLIIDGGTPVTSIVAPTMAAVNTVTLGSAGSTEYFGGTLDDVRVYNRVLSASQINSLAIGRQPSTYLATQTMTGAPTIAGDMVIAAGLLSVGGNDLTIGGSWWNYGGIFRATGADNVTFNGSGTNFIRSGGHEFQDITINGSGSWTLADNMDVARDKTLFMTAGTMDFSSRTFRGGQIHKVASTTITPSTSTVVVNSSANRSLNTGSFYNLRIEVPSETNLVSYWKFDQGEGPLAWNAVNISHHATLTNGPFWANSGLPSAIGFVNQGAMHFDGVNDYLEVAAAVVSSAAAFSACAWAKFDTFNDHQTLVSIDGTNVAGFGVKFDNTNDKFQVGMRSSDSTGATHYSATGTTTPVAGTWYHVCGTFDGTNNKVYVNGALEGTSATVSSTWVASGNTIIGAVKWAGLRDDYVDGMMDDVRIYNTALTAAQVTALAAGRYANTGTSFTHTMTAAATIGGALTIDSGTLHTGTSTFTTAVTGAATVNTGTLAIGGGGVAVTNTLSLAGGLAVNKDGTLTLATAGGRLRLANETSLNMDGTMNASTTEAHITNNLSGSAGSYYSLKIGSTSTATPTLNITGLQVKNTDTDGMYINAVDGAATTLTRFDNIYFAMGTGTRLLQIYAPSLYLVSNGCTFDGGVASGTTTYNVTLRGDGSATETRALFGNATCATNRTPCENHDNDDDLGADGLGDTIATNAAVAQWVTAAQSDTSGSIEGFPTAALDWNTFVYYSTYVAYHDVGGGTADRIYLRDSAGNPKSATSYWDTPSGEELIGTPRFDTVSSVHYVYVATTSGKVYRLVDDATAKTLTLDNSGSWVNPNNPYNCSCTITTPLSVDTNNIYWGGTASGNKVWTLAKTTRTLATSSPVTVTAVISGAAPAGWTSGQSYLFMGSAAHFYKVNVSTQTLTTDNSSPTGNVNGRLTIIRDKVYGADNRGSLWVLDAANFGTTLWSYHDDTNHNACASGSVCAVTSSPYVDWALQRAFYGDSDGHLYASYNSTGTTGAQLTNFPFRPGSVSDVYAAAPFYASGVLVAGTTTGNLYIIDVNGGSGPVLKQTYKFGTATRVSGIGYDSFTSSYMVSTANATTKDGKLIYIPAMADATPGSI